MTPGTTDTSRANPSATANPINKLFFWWTVELFKKGVHSNLKKEDLYRPLAADESECLANRLEKAWYQEMKKTGEKIDHKIGNCDGDKKNSVKPSLTKAIFRTFWLEYSYIGILLLFQTTVLRTLQPILQGRIINYFDDVNDEMLTTKNDALMYTFGLVITVLGITFILHHMNLASQQVGMRIRVACCSLIYRKSLKLSKLALNQTAAGQMVNLLSNDVNRFDQLPMFFNFLWIMPIEIIVVGYVMWETIGLSAFVGIGSLLIMAVPIQSYVWKVSGTLRAMIAQLTDRRVQLMNELISGIQTIKMYAWEKPFNKIVSNTRLSEINLIKHSSYLKGLYLSLMVFTERTTLFVTVVVYIFMGNAITAQVTFALAGYFNILQMIAIVFFPQGLIMCGEAAISIGRIQDFLLLDEISNTTSADSINMTISKEESAKLTNPISNPVSVELERVSASWTVGQLPPTLCEVSLKINGGQLCSVIGPVGAGKSSLFNALLQELPLGAGTIKLLQFNHEHNATSNHRRYIKDNPGLTISYASQDPWLFSGTVRENILFGQVYDQARYQEVAKVCSLLHDFKQFPNSDLTIVGDRGTSLSGGQRARINLARAIYQQADLYLLDDPLSAVDARVARHLFEDCILHYLRGKTRILITHQLHFLKQSDIIAVMKHGFIKDQGTFDSLRETSDGFNELLNRLKEDDVDEAEIFNENDFVNKMNEEGRSLLNYQDRILHLGKILPNPRRISTKSHDSHFIISDDEFAADVEIEGEAMATGKLSRQIYIRYIRNGGGIISLILLVINFVLSQVVISGGDYWLGYWTNLESVRSCLHYSTNQCELLENEYNSIVNDTLFGFYSLLDGDGLLPTNYAIYIYSICVIGCIVLSISRSFFFMNVCMNAGRKLHNDMFFNIIHATMLFFNTNPSGRVLNRFSKDVGAMDELLPKAALETLQIFLVLIGIIVIIVIINPWMVVPVIIIGIIFYIIQNYFLNTVRDIERLEGIAKSPVFSHVSATLDGLTTIRSRNADIQQMLCKEFDQYQDNHTAAWYLSIATASAFGFVLDLMSCIFISCVCFSFILIDRDNVFGGSVGLAISQSLILTGMVQYGVRQATDVQSQMTAVERIVEYTDLPKERSGELSSSLPENWLSCGKIEMRRVFLSYKNGDSPVLKNIDLILEGGWKVGVVGRTGAGKSSIIAALFRLADDGLQGEILIDGRDTSSIGLEDLRANISIIPQQPVLFSETLRYNLDPFSRYSDDILYDVLREVELNDASLDQWVNGGGTNFSVGQRQLICLARAILRNNRIIVLDEATANIDSRTDALIQRTIRTKFANCTVITVAHRLNTIIDSDKVLVMEDGRVVEFDGPHELLYGNPDGYFSRMIAHTGETTAKKLHEDAKAYHDLRLLSNDKKNVMTNQNIDTINEHLSDSSSV